MKKELNLFTTYFPYHKVSETFLETEILFLSEHFDVVNIYPSNYDHNIRETPLNVIIKNDLIKISKTKKDKIIALIKNFNLVFEILFSEIKRIGFKKTYSNFNHIIDEIAIQFFKYKVLHNQVDQKAIYYDYWSLNSTLALAMLKKHNPNISFIARAHGYDLYDERNLNVGVLFRNFVLKYIDTLFVISQQGKTYLENKIPNKWHSKLHVSRLGVLKTTVNNIQIENSYTLVSCSSLSDFKNVHQIPLVLQNIEDLTINWIHFGDGEMKEELIKNATLLPKNIKFEFKGNVGNNEVISFYQENKVDIFLSLSDTEGIPVSMMEAQSFGIPIIAKPVGGIPEIVMDNITGKLLKNQNHQIIAEEIKKELLNPKSKEQILDSWNNNFNADLNYKRFIEMLK